MYTPGPRSARRKSAGTSSRAPCRALALCSGAGWGTGAVQHCPWLCAATYGQYCRPAPAPRSCSMREGSGTKSRRSSPRTDGLGTHPFCMPGRRVDRRTRSLRPTSRSSCTVFGFCYLLVWGYIADLSMVPRLRRGRLAGRALSHPFILRGQN